MCISSNETSPLSSSASTIVHDPNWSTAPGCRGNVVFHRRSTVNPPTVTWSSLTLTFLARKIREFVRIASGSAVWLDRLMTNDDGSRAEFVRVRPVFEILGVSDQVGYQMIEAGKFPVPVIKIGGLWKVRRRDLDAFVAGPEHVA